jgi:hypothetical protein
MERSLEMANTITIELSKANFEYAETWVTDGIAEEISGIIKGFISDRFHDYVVDVSVGDCQKDIIDVHIDDDDGCNEMAIEDAVRDVLGRCDVGSYL